MMSMDPSYRNLIQFVPEKITVSQIDILCKDGNKATCPSGNDIKEFYESVICTEPSNSSDDTRSSRVLRKRPTKITSKKIKQHEKPRKQSEHGDHLPSEFAVSHLPCASVTKSETPLSEQSKTQSKRKHFQFLHAAQTGDISRVQKNIEGGVDINYQDFFGWTALMCASKAGHKHIVEYLLQQGADKHVCNNDNQTAVTLAQLEGHTDVINTIEEFDISSSNVGQTVDIQQDDFYCSTCNGHFSDGCKSHLTSTIHLFNSGKRPQHPAYLLPESNRGFQMMLRTGWQIDKGLGSEGQGVKYPIKTKLKRDRKGLGNDTKDKSKITHFNPHDKSAVERDHFFNRERKISVRKSAQLAAKSKERKERQIEHALRLQFR